MKNTGCKIILALMILCLLMTAPLCGCTPIIPPPADAPLVTYGEFPFSLVYEVDGEQFTISDSFVCEYGGDVWDGSQYDRYRTWNGHHKNDSSLILRRISDTEYISFSFGHSAAYYMGDEQSPNYRYGKPTVTYRNSEDFASDSSIFLDSFYSSYGVRIISYEMSDPIENIFIPAENSGSTYQEFDYKNRFLVKQGMKLINIFQRPCDLIDLNSPLDPEIAGEGWYVVTTDLFCDTLEELQADFDAHLDLDQPLSRDWQFMEYRGLIYGRNAAEADERFLSDRPVMYTLKSGTETDYEVEVTFYTLGEEGYYFRRDLVTVRNGKLTAMENLERELIYPLVVAE